MAAAIREEGGSAVATELNVVDYAAVEALVYETVKRSGRLADLLKNLSLCRQMFLPGKRWMQLPGMRLLL
ncbi:hypothetical protein [Sporomusa acidovorans]|uniref:hypothetical protein n=1 Tax=Sporomusa acidovorans TaxID=112900 RepID=UPI000B873FC5|nr:hypothetical protein [Sporomusa acidovorans]